VIDKKPTLLPSLGALDDPRFHDDISLNQGTARRRRLNLFASVNYLLQELVAAARLAVTLLILG